MLKKLFLCGIAFALTITTNATSWTKKTASLMTPWGEALTSDNVWAEYPRPSMTRQDWMNLNGEWGYFKRTSVNYDYESSQSLFKNTILVPFPVESALSGIMDTDHQTNKNSTHMYRRTFTLPDSYAGKSVLLHFGAVDWRCKVYINGKEAGSHDGGSDPFTFDITDLLKSSGEQEIEVAVWDPGSDGGQPTGKQSNSPNGIWYTQSSGIWQTVWLEPVDAIHVESYEALPDIDAGTVTVRVNTSETCVVELTAKYAGEVIAKKSRSSNSDITLGIPSAKLWSPDSPNLYDLEITLKKSGEEVDKVTGYFGMRKFSRGMYDGKPCVLLNNKPLYLYGPLDQGWWPDGLLTPPSYEAMIYDLQTMKEFGMNMVRKHIKVENDLWYDWCDKHGLVVWQDMPSGGTGGSIGNKAVCQEDFYNENDAIINALRQHPSIGAWVVYNESWGQDTGSGMEHTHVGVKRVQDANHDPYRFVHAVTGWVDVEMGDFIDMHSYPTPNASVNPVNERVASCGEFGGITLLDQDHMWSNSQQVYTSVTDNEYYSLLYDNYTDRLQYLQKENGLWMSVYTQITDVEAEVNGILTYDRKVLKVTPTQKEMMRKNIERTINSRYKDAVTIVKAGDEDASIEWRYTTDEPSGNWQAEGYDDSSWNKGVADFGGRTKWTTDDIWIRRQFNVEGVTANDLSDLRLWLRHDEDAEVYINNVLAAKVTGYNNSYEQWPIFEEALNALRIDGTNNTIAIHCHQTIGGQDIDCGLKLRKYDNNSDLDITDVPERTPKPDYATSEDKAYLMAYTTTSSDKLHYAYSLDGAEWTPLNANRPVMKGDYASLQLTSPFIQYSDAAGKYYLVAQPKDTNYGFYHLESTDLINWTATEGGAYTDLTAEADANKITSPEWLYEPGTKRYMVYWTANVDNKNTVYYTTSRNWTTFTGAAVYFDPGISVTDPHIAQMGDDYYAFYYNSDRNLLCAPSSTAKKSGNTFGSYNRLFGVEITKANAPQTYPALDGSGYFLSYQYTNGSGTGLSGSGNPTEIKWYPYGEDTYSMPEGYANGSVVVITKNELSALQKAYDQIEFNLLPTAETDPQFWKYQTTSANSTTWTSTSYRDSSWPESLAGFGGLTPPNAIINTQWTSSTIRIRHALDLTGMTREQINAIVGRIYHDEDVVVYFNGVEAFSESGYQTSYKDIAINQEALDALTTDDQNVIAIQCVNAGGGQYIDFGLTTIKPNPTGISRVNYSESENDNIYNLSGQKLNSVQKGVNIINGRKILK